MDTSEDTPTWLASEGLTVPAESLNQEQSAEVVPEPDLPPAWLTQDAPYATPSPVLGPQEGKAQGFAAAPIETAETRDEPPRGGPRPKKDLGEMPRAWAAMRILNPIVAVLIILCVLSKLDTLEFFEKIDAWVICIYLLCFSCLILCFEGFGTWVLVAKVIAGKFGFMYTVPGRLGFTILTGVLVLALNTVFSYIVCTLTLIVAVYNAAVMIIYPQWTAEMMERHRDAALRSAEVKK